MSKENKEELQEYKSNLQSGFWAFWVNNYKMSFLLILVIIVIGLTSLYEIPKESTPDIEVPILQITTTYEWVNADDVDSLVTDKIVSSLQWIDWIKQIDATSRLWVSSITVELFDNINPREKLITVQDEVDTISLPSEVDDPLVSDITTESQMIFQLVIYSQIFSQDELKEKARNIRDQIEWRWWVANIDVIWWWDYEYKIEVDQGELDSIGLSIQDIAGILNSYHSNTPLWNFTVWDFNYDFRIEWEAEDIKEIMNLTVHWQDWSYVKLSDIANYKKKYEDEAKRYAWLPDDKNRYSSVALEFEKDQQTSIFAASRFAKSEISDVLEDAQYSGIWYTYTMDLADLIIEDYYTLARNWWVTLFLVFSLLFLSIWFKQSILATLMLPLSFLVTFFVLNSQGLTLNFLTNFSLVLSFGIAIDVLIVIIEWITQKIKLWYSPKSAVLLAVKDLSKPVIAWASTTLAAFLPLVFLPGMMWNFLSYIPLTVFSVVLTALILALTLNLAVSYKLNKNRSFYFKNQDAEEMLSKKEKLLLDHDRANKFEKKDWKQKKDRFFAKVQNLYISFLTYILKYKFTRISAILIPIGLLILSFVLLSPRIGFTLFPDSDVDFMQVNIERPVGASTEYMETYTKWFEEIFNNIIEIQDYYYYVDGNEIWVDINLLWVNERRSLNLRDVFEVEKEVLNRLSYLDGKWLDVSGNIQSWWPPTGSPIWIRLIADDIDSFDKLLKTWQEFENWLATRQWISNTSISSDELPGQYVFDYRDYSLNQFELTPDVVSNQVFTYLNGMNVGSIKKWKDEFDIIVKSDKFGDKINPTDIMDIYIWQVQVGDVADIKLWRSIDSIQRRDQNIMIEVSWELVRWQEARTAEIQSKFRNYAQQYEYPEWVSFEEAGEAQENMELIVSILTAFIIALIVIFSILVLQFNSYSKPFIIIYSVVLAMLWVNIWLYVTGNPYSLPFGIGFVALTWIVVNNAIILIDRIMANLEKTEDNMKALIEASRSRFTPIFLTTLTTIFGILPLALENEFWAGLGFTVIFGLMFGALMTLFVIPCIYYEIFIKAHKWFIRKFCSWFWGIFCKKENNT